MSKAKSFNSIAAIACTIALTTATVAEIQPASACPQTGPVACTDVLPNDLTPDSNPRLKNILIRWKLSSEYVNWLHREEAPGCHVDQYVTHACTMVRALRSYIRYRNAARAATNPAQKQNYTNLANQQLTNAENQLPLMESAGNTCKP